MENDLSKFRYRSYKTYEKNIEILEKELKLIKSKIHMLKIERNKVKKINMILERERQNYYRHMKNIVTNFVYK